MMTSELTWALRIILAAFLGGCIGLERESHGREAGFRTLILVCSGTALIMVTSLRLPELFRTFDAGSVLRLDPARLAYGVLAGIGFLGAGAIVRDKKRVRGITTAACLWVVTAIGLACGCGFYFLAVLTAALALVVLYFLRLVEEHILKDSYAQLLVVQSGEASFAPYLTILQEEGTTVLARRIKIQTPPPVTELEFMVRYKGGEVGERLAKKILALPGVKMVEWR